MLYKSAYLLDIHSPFPNIHIEIAKVLTCINKTAQNIENYDIRLSTY